MVEEEEVVPVVVRGGGAAGEGCLGPGGDVPSSGTCMHTIGGRRERRKTKNKLQIKPTPQCVWYYTCSLLADPTRAFSHLTKRKYSDLNTNPSLQALKGSKK